jgi:cytochrome c oxidase subunit 2
VAGNSRRGAPWLSAGLGAAAALLACAPALADTGDKQQSTLNPAGPGAQHISELFYIIVIPALLVILLVGGAIIVAAVRFRRKSEDEPQPRQIGGNNALEFTWTVIPALILLTIFIVSVFQLPFLRHTPSEAADAMHIHIVGRQWAWSFEYPGKNAKGQTIRTFGALTIPAGQVVNLDIDSVDVIHSWSVPNLSGRLDAIPGMQNHTWVLADHPGTYYGQCTEFCGLSHAAMTAKVVALPPAEFDQWFALQQRGGS